MIEISHVQLIPWQLIMEGHLITTENKIKGQNRIIHFLIKKKGIFFGKKKERRN